MRPITLIEVPFSFVASKVQRGNRMACREHHKLRGANEKERIGRDQERINVHLGKPCKGRIDVGNGAGVQDIDLLSDGAGGGFNVTYLCCAKGEFGFTRTAIVVALGRSSRSSPNFFGSSSTWNPLCPVMLPPGTIYDQGTTNLPNRRRVDLLGGSRRAWRASSTDRRRGRLRGLH